MSLKHQDANNKMCIIYHIFVEDITYVIISYPKVSSEYNIPMRHDLQKETKNCSANRENIENPLVIIYVQKYQFKKTY